MKRDKTRVKIPMTKWSLDVDDDIMIPLAFIVPILGILMLTVIFGFKVVYFIMFIIVSYMFVIGIDIIDDSKE